MVTAAARTNSVGQTVSGIDSVFGDQFCKTGHFKISKPEKRVAQELPTVDRFSCIGIREVQWLIDSSLLDYQLVGEALLDDGIPLDTECEVMRWKPEKKRARHEVRLDHPTLGPIRMFVLKRRAYYKTMDEE